MNWVMRLERGMRMRQGLSSQGFWLPFILLLMSPVLPAIVSMSSSSNSVSHHRVKDTPCLSLPPASSHPSESLSFPATSISSKSSPSSSLSSSKHPPLTPQLSLQGKGRGKELKRKTNSIQIGPLPPQLKSKDFLASNISYGSNWTRGNNPKWHRHHRDPTQLSPHDQTFRASPSSSPPQIFQQFPLNLYSGKSSFTVDVDGDGDGDEKGVDPDHFVIDPANKDEEEEEEKEEKKIENWAATFPLGATCRHRVDLPPLVFQLETCAFCYNYMRDKVSLFGFPSKKLGRALVTVNDPLLGDVRVIGLRNGTDTAVPANISDYDSPVYATFANADASRKWVDCCLAAERCCKKTYKVRPTTPGAVVSQLQLDVESGKKCPSTWDGWQCWDATLSGTSAEAPCPHYIYFMTEPPSCITSVPKDCDHDGHWQRKNLSGTVSEWTNYGTCAAVVIQVQKQRANVHVMAYFVSIIALIPALIIFFIYKQLRVHRIILHRNLFFSLLVNSLLMLAFKNFVILKDLSSESGASIINENSWACRLLFILTKYSRMTNYMWMFCEGYYLHKLIAAGFAEQKSLLVFYLLGWVFPVVPTAVYAGLRAYNANDQCWVVPHDSYEWVLNFPSLLSLLINMGFLINIIRILVTKIAAHSGANEPSQFRKAVRATLLLLPLFGLHFVVTIYRPPSGSGSCEWIELYYYINYVMDGLQGFFCSASFCYLNNEVTTLFRRTYTRWREERDAASNSHSGGGSRTNNTRNDRGRSVISTHYTSVPASPEPGSITRLTITNSEMSNIGGPSGVSVTLNSSDGLITPAGTTGGGGDGKPSMTNGKPNLSLLGTNSESGGWHEISLVGTEDSVEMRQTFSLTPNSQVPSTTSTAVTTKNGVLGEHQL